MGNGETMLARGIGLDFRRVLENHFTAPQSLSGLFGEAGLLQGLVISLPVFQHEPEQYTVPFLLNNLELAEGRQRSVYMCEVCAMHIRPIECHELITHPTGHLLDDR